MTADVLPITGLSSRAVTDQESGPGPRVWDEETAVTSRTTRRLEDLWEVAAGAATPNWDGYGAEKASAGAVRLAGELLLSLPETWPSPEIAVDPDGDIDIEWRRGPDRVVSISVSGSGELHYAALFGRSRVHGAEGSAGELPQVVVQALARLYRER